MKETTGPFSFYKDKGQLFVTARSYEVVLGSLSLEEENIKPDEIILSIGDGFSEFPEKLEEKTGCSVVSIDPMYADVPPYSSYEEARAKLDEAKKRKPHLENVIITERWSGKFPTQKPENSKRAAASVYELPFANNTFDRAVINEVSKYIDLPRAIKELGRVLKESSEIRFGGVETFLFILEKKPYLVLRASSEQEKLQSENVIRGLVEGAENGFKVQVLIRESHVSGMGGLFGTIVLTRNNGLLKETTNNQVKKAEHHIAYDVNPEVNIYDEAKGLIFAEIKISS